MKNEDRCFVLEGKDLFTEIELVHYDCPLLFVCKDLDGRRYLSMLVDDEDMVYIVGLVTDKELASMLGKRKTMREVFVESTRKWRIHTGNFVEDDAVELVIDFQDNELPIVESYYDIENDLIECYYKGLYEGMV